MHGLLPVFEGQPCTPSTACGGDSREDCTYVLRTGQFWSPHRCPCNLMISWDREALLCLLSRYVPSLQHEHSQRTSCKAPGSGRCCFCIDLWGRHDFRVLVEILLYVHCIFNGHHTIH